MATCRERALRRRDVERHLAAEEAVGAEPPEHEIGVGDGRLACRRGRSRPGPAPRPRSAGRRAGRRASTRAIEPPPVPTSKMSIMAICTGSAWS